MVETDDWLAEPADFLLSLLIGRIDLLLASRACLDCLQRKIDGLSVLTA